MLTKRSFLSLILFLFLPILLFPYTVRSGDILKIEVVGYPELLRDCPVDIEGFISFPYIGRLKVEGKTIEEITGRVKEGLSDVLSNPEVIVSISKLAPRNVYISGAINEVVDLGFQDVTLSKLISMIELNLDDIDLSSVKVIKKNKTLVIDLSGILIGEKPLEDPLIEEGDQIILPKKSIKNYVKILGAVQRPGIYRYEENMKLLDLVAQSGGFKENRSEELSIQRGNSVKKYSVSEILSGKDVKLLPGDVVYVPESKEKFAYILGAVVRPGSYTFLKNEEITLRNLIAKSGGFLEEPKYLEKIIITRNGSEVAAYDPEEVLSGKIDEFLEIGDVVYVKEFENLEVHVLGAVKKPGVFQVSPKEKVDLREIIAKAGGLSKDIEEIDSITISRKGEIIRLDPGEIFLNGKLFAILPGDIVQVKEYIPKKAYILGFVKHPGLYYFEKNEKFSLRNLISKAGGFIDENKVRMVKVVGKEEKTYMIQEVLEKDIDLEDSAFVYVEPAKEKYVYVVGLVSKPGYISFLPEEKMTLSRALAKAGDVPSDMMERVEAIVIVHEDNSTEKYDPQIIFNKTQDPVLKTGDLVIVKEMEEKYVYVVGPVSKPGYISFLPEEKMTLSKALAKAGGILPDKLRYVKDIKVIHEDSSSEVFSPEDAFSENKDFILKKGDLVVVEEVEEKYAYIVGNDLQKRGKIVLDPEEPLTLLTVLKKAGIEDFDLLESVKVMSEGKILLVDPKKLLTEDWPLKNGDTIMVKILEGTRIYFTGDVTGYVFFDPEEKPTLDRAIAKIGKIEEKYINSLRILRKNGSTMTLNEVVSIPLMDGDVVEVDLKEEVRVYIGGFVKNPGLVVFQPDEKPSLKKAISKAGGYMEDDETVADEIVLMRNSERKVFDVEIIKSGRADILLKDGDYINVTQRPLRYAFALGEGLKNGKIVFKDEEEFNVKTLLGKAGGLNEKASKEIEVIMPDGEIKKVSFDDVLKDGGPELENGAVVLVPEETKNFVYIVGEVKQPGAYRIKGDVNLLQVISWAGGLSDWAQKTKILLRRNGREMELDINDLSKVEKTKIMPGDVVYIPPLETNKVYVLGEVKTPGIVGIDKFSTVFDTIMKAGGFTKDAVYSNIFLFKEGSEENVVTCDLSGFIKGKGPSVNPKVAPGDVIYVPRSPFVKVSEVLPVVRDVLGIISTSKDIMGW